MFRKTTLSYGAVALATVALILAAPRAAHAIAAALVQVTNTTANPVVTQSMARQASQLIRMRQDFVVSGNSQCAQNAEQVCQQLVQADGDGDFVNFPNGYTVPAGQKLVITTVNFYPNLNNTAGSADVQLYADMPFSGQYGSWNVNRTVSSEFHPTIVVNSGHALEVVVTMTPSADLTVEIQGYLTAN